MPYFGWIDSSKVKPTLQKNNLNMKPIITKSKFAFIAPIFFLLFLLGVTTYPSEKLASGFTGSSRCIDVSYIEVPFAYAEL